MFKGFNIHTEDTGYSICYTVTTHSNVTNKDVQFVLAHLYPNNHVTLFYQRPNGVFKFVTAEYSTKHDAEEAIRCHLAVMEARGIV